jgi:hypothetical protein
MKSENGLAKFAGALFLTAMAASLVGGAGFIEPVLSSQYPLAVIAQNRSMVLMGIFLELINGLAVIGIAAAMFRVLKPYSETVSLEYLLFRLVEAIFCCAMVISPLSLLTLSEKFSQGGAVEEASWQVAVNAAITERASLSGLLVPVFFCLGAFLFYFLLFRSNLLPRFISIWGFAAALLILILNVTQLFGKIPTGTGMFLALPMILNEIFLGFWLIIKGFNTPRLDPNTGR